MVSKKIQIGLIGLGDMGLGHMECLKLFPHVAVVALCDSDKKRLKTASGRLKKPAKLFSSYQKLLAEKDLEAVFVSLPNFLHAPVGLAVLKSGKHLFLEKPLAHTVADAKKLLATAKKSDLIFQVGHVYRHSPFFQTMANRVAADAIGKPVLIWCHEFRQPFPQRDWFYDRKKSGGTFIEKNCHHFDLFNWFANDRPKQVCAFADLRVLKSGTKISCSYCPDGPKVLKKNNTIDNGWAMVEYRHGAKANLGLCMFVRPPREIWRGLELGIIGSNGKILIGNVDFGVMTLYGGSKKEEQMKIKNPHEGKWHSGMVEEHEAFLHAIRKGKKSLKSVQTAYDAVVLGAGAEQSAKKGKIILV